MKRIKDLAVEENIPALSFSTDEPRDWEAQRQLQAQAERPARLRVLEQAADVVFFINRPELQGNGKGEDGESMVGIGNINILKNRNGATGTTASAIIPIWRESLITKLLWVTAKKR